MRISAQSEFLHSSIDLQGCSDGGRTREYELIFGRLAKYVPLLLDALPARERYSKNIGLWISGSGGLIG
jgi:hypothetical protein